MNSKNFIIGSSRLSLRQMTERRNQKYRRTETKKLQQMVDQYNFKTKLLGAATLVIISPNKKNRLYVIFNPNGTFTLMDNLFDTSILENKVLVNGTTETKNLIEKWISNAFADAI